MELCDLPAFELSLLLRQKQISAEEITRACLNRVDQVDGRSGALDSGSVAGAELDRPAHVRHGAVSNDGVRARVLLALNRLRQFASGLRSKGCMFPPYSAKPNPV